MRILISMVLGCALLIGLNLAASSGAPERGAQPLPELSSPADPAIEDIPEPDTEGAYECRYSPYCQRASQCTTYCAGGIPVCFQGCCSCAS